MPEQNRPRSDTVELASRVHAAAIHVLRLLRTEDDALGLTAPKLSALSVLVFRGAVTIGELARAEQVTPATISRLVSDLERLGLVVRTVDEADARVRRVTPTETGVELLHEGRRRRVARLAAAMELISPAQRGVLSQATTILEQIAASPR